MSISPWAARTVISNAAQRSGNMDCRLVNLRDGTKGRVVDQLGERILVRGSKDPSLVEWVRADSASHITRPKE